MTDFSLARSVRVEAAPATVHALLDDFREWQKWSPWEELDPAMEHAYSGPERGVGARHAWKGNRKAGEGSMEVVESTPSSVVCDLRFVKPFKAQNLSRFDLAGAGTGTDVTWTMTGRQNPLMRLLGRLFFDRAIAKDFERGLAKLKTVAEGR